MLLVSLFYIFLKKSLGEGKARNFLPVIKMVIARRTNNMLEAVGIASKFYYTRCLDFIVQWQNLMRREISPSVEEANFKAPLQNFKQ